MNTETNKKSGFEVHSVMTFIIPKNNYANGFNSQFNKKYFQTCTVAITR